MDYLLEEEEEEEIPKLIFVGYNTEIFLFKIVLHRIGWDLDRDKDKDKLHLIKYNRGGTGYNDELFSIVDRSKLGVGLIYNTLD